MQTFTVEVKEELVKIVEVMADNVDEALATAKLQWKNEEIVLDYSDFDSVTFKIT